MGIDREMLSQLGHLLRPIAMRAANAVARGVVQLVDDSKKLQLVQLGVLEGEDVPDGEHHQSYGFASVPLVGAEHVTIFPNGDRGHPLVIAISDRRHRPTGGQPGQVTMHHYAGAKVTMLANGDVVVQPGGSGVVRLGSGAAADGAIKGTTRNTAEQTFLTAMNTFIAAVVPGTGAPALAIAAFQAAITAFKSAAAGAVSARVNLE